VSNQGFRNCQRSRLFGLNKLPYYISAFLSPLDSEFHIGSSAKEEEYASVANAFGAYLGETLIRNLGKGSWMRSAQNAFAVTIDDQMYFFPSKVYRRIKNGEEDNVVALYLIAFNNHSNEKLNLDLTTKIKNPSLVN